jgi:hypothetical protein
MKDLLLKMLDESHGSLSAQIILMSGAAFAGEITRVPDRGWRKQDGYLLQMKAVIADQRGNQGHAIVYFNADQLSAFMVPDETPRAAAPPSIVVPGRG